MAAKKSKKRPTGATSATARIVEEVHADLGEASAVVVLGNGRFLVADDADGLKLVERRGTAKKASTRIINDVDGVEGLCRIGRRVLAVREEDSEVVELDVTDVTDVARGTEVTDVKGLKKSKRVGALERPPGSQEKKNKGWEGIAHLPKSASFDGKDHVVAVHEGKPRAIGVFAWPSLAAEGFIELDEELAERLPDLADIAVDRAGDLWIVSDEAECIVRVKLKGVQGPLALVSVVGLPLEDGEKPEGIDFADDDSMWIVTDETGRLLKLSVDE